MTTLEQKHVALLDEARRRGRPEAGLRLCLEILALSSAIDRDCAARLAPHQLSEGKFVLLFLLLDRPDGGRELRRVHAVAHDVFRLKGVCRHSFVLFVLLCDVCLLPHRKPFPRELSAYSPDGCQTARLLTLR